MSLSHSPKIVTDSLEVHLDSSNLKSYPNIGSVWYDLSGNQRNHIISNTSLTTIDNVKCFDVSSLNKYISNPTKEFTFSNSYTLISWARPLANSSVTTWRTLWRTSPNDHPLLIQKDTNLIGYYDSDTSSFISYGANAVTLGIENKWTMFTVVGSGTTTTLYINNGQQFNSINYNAVGNNQDAIGNLDGGSGNQYFGYISTASIYSKSFSLSEIKQNFNALRGRYGI